MQQHTTPIQGLWLPLITPFNDGHLDETSLTRLIAHYLDQPVDGFIMAATTGEGLTIDGDETERLVAIATETVAGRRPVFLGLSGSDSRRLTAALDRAETWPVDGYLITCPYYSRPPQDGLYRHFAMLASRTDRPVVLYNIPYRTGVNLANETLLRLAELPNVVGVKDCCVNAAQSFDLLRDRPPGFGVLTGEDALFYSALTQGADGGILASAHIDTAAFAAVRDALLAGDQPGALRLWRDLVDLARLLFAEPSPAPIKHCLWRAGLIASPEVRLPMTEVSPGLADRLAAEMKRRSA